MRPVWRMSSASSYVQLLVLERRNPRPTSHTLRPVARTDTLGDMALVREWGRLGAQGRRRLQSLRGARSTERSARTWLTRKLRKGCRSRLGTSHLDLPSKGHRDSRAGLARAGGSGLQLGNRCGECRESIVLESFSASSATSRAIRRAVLVGGTAPSPARAAASQRAVSSSTMPVGRSAQTTNSTNVAIRKPLQAVIGPGDVAIEAPFSRC